MIRVTVDTNVLVSATFWNGNSEAIIQKAERKELELVLSREIIEEFAKVLDYSELQDKIKKKNLEMKRTIAKIVSLSTIVEPERKLDVVKADPDDNKILEAAETGKVDAIISKDNHLLALHSFKGIRILSPEEFLRNRG